MADARPGGTDAGGTEPEDGSEPEDGPEPVVGRTGARFGGAPRRRRQAREHPPPAHEEDPPTPENDEEPSTDVLPVADAAVPSPLPEDETRLTVRPYVLTGGRTRPVVDLGIETLVSVRPDSGAGLLSPAHRAVLDRCAVACSVAEVAATTGVPLGVARVLIADLVGTGTVQVHGEATTGGPDQALLARVLDGLRKL